MRRLLILSMVVAAVFGLSVTGTASGRAYTQTGKMLVIR